jgi:MFS family permease
VAPLSPRLVERVGTKIVVGAGLLLTAAGTVVIAGVPVTDGYPQLLLGALIASLGMGLVMAPATESIMGSLPRAKAGVGSAMNDTTRQMGGALGVAVIGSILAGSYRPGVGGKLAAAGLSGSALDAAKDSVGGAVQVATRLPEPLRTTVTGIARAEFVDSLGGALLVGSVVVLVAAVVVFLFLPARAGDAREADSDALDGIASLTFAEAEGVVELDAPDRDGAASREARAG